MIHEVGNEFDERNMFLQVTLGVLALLEGFDALVARYGRPGGAADAPGADRDAAAGDAVLDFVLGLVAFSQRARHHLAAAIAETPARAVAAPPPVAAARGLLS